MKKLFIIFIALMAVITFSSCERVEPNHVGVKMNNYGKAGKSDFTIETGKVWVLWPGVELFQAPLWDQRADFGDRILHLKASNNTEFTSVPMYSYNVIKERSVDVVFANSQLGSGSNFMKALEDNILETRIYDIIKEESRKWTTEDLMADGGSLKFEKEVEVIVREAFLNQGLNLLTFSCQLGFSESVTKTIDKRNEVNTNISVLEQQIAEQKKRNELALLKAEENRLLSSGLTDKILMQQFIEKWDGKATLYWIPPTLIKPIQ